MKINFFPFTFFLEEPLFLIPKSHPESKYPLAEWRLSFSFVERKILFNIPDYQRTAYLIIKQKIYDLHNKPTGTLRQMVYNRHNTRKVTIYKSHHLKTVLLELTVQSCKGIENVHLFATALVERLVKAYETGDLPNFFIPSQNLLSENEGSDITELVNMLNGIMIKPEITHAESSNAYTFSLGLYRDSYESRVPVALVTLLNNVKNVTHFPILANDESKTIPQNITVMFLAEIYNNVLSSLQTFFCERPSAHRMNQILDYLRELIKSESTKEGHAILYGLRDKEETICTKVIQMKRIARLVQSQGTISDSYKKIVDEVLKFPVDFLKEYISNFWQRIPHLPENRIKCEELSGGSDSLEPDVMRTRVTDKVEKLINEINETEKAQQVNQFFHNVTALLKNAISEKKLVQLSVPEHIFFGISSSGRVTDLFDLKDYFLKLDDKILKYKIEENIFEIYCIFAEFFKQIIHCDNEERMEKEVVHRALVNILNKIRKLDSELEDIVDKNKSNLEEFLNHFYEMQKMPVKDDGMDQEDYEKQLQDNYMAEMGPIINQIREMNYSKSSDGSDSNLFLKSSGSHDSIMRIGSTKMIAKFESIKRCSCGKEELSGWMNNAPFDIFQFLYTAHMQPACYRVNHN